MTNEMRPQGAYKGKLTDWNYEESKAKGTPQMVLKFDIGNNGTAIVYLAMTEKTMTRDDGKPGFAASTLDKLGFNSDFADPQFTAADNEEEVELYCKHEAYQGAIKERWNVSNFEGRPAGEDAIARANRLYRSVIAVKQSSSAAPSRPAPSSGPPKRPPPAQQKCDANAAWTVFEKKGKGEELYFKAIEIVEKEEGVAEADFKDKQWNLVACHADPERPPF